MTHRCFNCGKPTEAVVSRVSPPQLARYIFTADGCYRAWLNLRDKKAAA